MGVTSQSRKAHYKPLVWMESQREELFGIEAPRRSFSALPVAQSQRWAK